MPFEVKVIGGVAGRRSETDVANDIKVFYEKAKNLGGRVVDGFSMTEEIRLKDGNFLRASSLFLVAETPDATTEPDAPAE